MESLPQKQNNTQQSLLPSQLRVVTAAKLLARIEGLQSKDVDAVFAKVKESLPTKLDAIIDEPKVCELKLVVDENNIRHFLEAQIAWLAGQMNVAHNITEFQLDFISEMLVDKFPNESLADFVFVFKRMAMGYYGPDYHKLDAASIGTCIQKHLEEKAFTYERENTKGKKESQEKDTVVNYERFKERLEKERVKSREDKIRSFELKVEAEEGRKSMKGYRPSTVEETIKKEKHIQWIRENYDSFTGKPKATWISEEEWLRLPK